MNKLIMNKDRFQTFQKIIQQLSTMVTELEFIATNNSLKIISMDGANICMACLNIKKEFFEEGTEFNEDNFGLNILKFNDILKRFKGEDVTIFLDKVVTVECKRKKITLKTTQILSERVAKPNLEYGLVMKMNSSVIKEILDDADAITSNDTGIVFAYDGFVKVAIENPQGTEYNASFKDIEIVEKVEVNKASYSKSYLRKMTIPSENVIVKIKNDYPITMLYDEGTWAMEYILAPRVNND